MATPLAGAIVDRGVEVEITWEHREQKGQGGGAIHGLLAIFGFGEKIK